MDEKTIELVLNKLEELGRNYGPAFSEQAIKYAHIKAFENTLIPLVVCGVCVFFAKRFLKDCRDITCNSTFYQEMTAPLATAVFFCIGIAMFIAALNPAAWYGLFDPAAYLSYRLFEKVL